ALFLIIPLSNTTGLVQFQREERNGDIIKGAYSFIDSDGKIRNVDYQADDLKGFRVSVKYMTK
ncbi:hypothetical protein HHI36_006166, partial [Cryptolaemus montrouzieri]